MNKKIVLIQSHCNTVEKINCLKENIQKLKLFNVDILLFSYISLPTDIVNSVNYFIYVANNPLLFEERQHYYWWANDEIKLETWVPDYGWTVFNQIITSYNTVKEFGYEHFYIFCYDLVFDSIIEKYINIPVSSVFTHIKPEDVDEFGIFKPVIFNTSLIFSVFNSKEMDILVNSLSKEEYIRKFDYTAEMYFELKLKENQIFSHLGDSVKDFISESNNIFNVSKNKEYDLFIDTEKLITLRLMNKNHKKISIVINNDMIDVINEITIYQKNMFEPLERFGCFIDNYYDNWLFLFQEKRKNKINILKK